MKVDDIIMTLCVCCLCSKDIKQAHYRIPRFDDTYDLDKYCVRKSESLVEPKCFSLAEINTIMRLHENESEVDEND